MLKVDSSKLTINANKAYYDGILFTGIAFTCDSVQVLFAKEYLDGDEVGEYKGFLNKNKFNPIYLRYALDESDDDYSCEPILFKNEKFTGLAYDFEMSYCIGEARIDSGVVIEEVTFYKNGNIESYEHIGKENGIYQYYEFNTQGAICSFSIKINPTFSWYCLFDGEDIKTFRCEGDWEQFSIMLDEQIKFKNIADISRLLKCSFYPRANISGNAIKESWLDEFVENKSFSHVNYLSISASSVKDLSIMKKIEKSNPRIKIDIY